MRLNSLTSLRFLAALGVFLHHFHFFSETDNHILKNLYSIFFEGFIGVTFFYILSGFIISYSHNKYVESGSYKVGEFLYNRFARLYPIHILTLVIAFFVYMGIDNYQYIDIELFLANALLLQSFIPDFGYSFSFNGVSWSISVEMFFYFSFTFLLTFNKKQLSILTFILFMIIVAHLFLLGSSERFSGWTFYVNPFFRIIDFMLGMIIFRIYKSNKFSINEKFATIMEVLSLLLLVAFITIGIKYIPIFWRFDLYYIFPFGFMVYVFSYGKGAISRLINNKVFILLGEASFSLYMIHQILISVLLRYVTPNINSLTSTLLFIIPVVIIGCLLSCLMFLRFEKPVNNWLRSIYVKYVK